MRSVLAPASLAVLALTLTSVPADAQRRYPLAPETSAGDYLHPMFEAWYTNPDGSHTISFGYYDRNEGGDPMYIPIGPDNFVTPSEYDGMQPEYFPERRERGVFTVTVPPDFPSTEAVTWTLRNHGGEYSVPGRWGVGAYEMSHLGMASGSLPPVIRMDPDGPVHNGIVEPFFAEDKEAEVGEPLELTIWARDNMREDASRDSSAVSVTWYKHQGAGAVVFSPDPTPPEPPAADSAAAAGRGGGGGGGGGAGGRGGGPPPPNVATAPVDGDGMTTVMATFAEPGNYVLRVFVIATGAGDSSYGNQCCWTAGYVRVEVDD